MPKNYRSPTVEETRKLEASRKLMADSIDGEKSLMSKMMPTTAKSAREGEAYNNAGYKKGGKVVKMANGGSARGYGISKVTNKTKYC